jgi:GAF domain-containing protein
VPASAASNDGVNTTASPRYGGSCRSAAVLRSACTGLPSRVHAAAGALRFSFTRPRRVTDEERAFLEALAGQCALALERASMFEREHTTVETLQRSLLPDRLPTVPGIILDASYLSA